jgi:hypothetical protein
MTSTVRWSLALWAVLALAVFSDLFDWRTRQAGFQFVTAQAARRAHGQPLDTIESGFRPLVSAAAMQSLAWAGLVLLAGTGATWLAARRAPGRR